MVFVSGQGPADTATGAVESAEFVQQARQVLANMDVLLRAAGSGRERVLKVQAYLTDLDYFATFNQVYGEFFEGCIAPARTTVQVAGLPGGIKVEVDAIAYCE
jgi:2-iminobutanoate/2-iminopropanoate deaminase